MWRIKLGFWPSLFAMWRADVWLRRSRSALRLHDKWTAIAQEPAEDMRAPRGLLIGIVLSMSIWLVGWLLWWVL